MSLSVAYFGGYNPDYSRVRIFIKGLRKNGVEVFECSDRSENKLRRLISLAKKYWSIKERVDCILVCEAGQAYVPLAWILAKLTNKPLVLDAFISYYHVISKESNGGRFRSVIYFALDYVACFLSDKVLVDTSRHADYFSKIFKLSRDRLDFVWVGSDEEIYYPRVRTKNNFTIFCVSSFYPIHGMQFVIEAARIIRDRGFHMEWVLAGDGLMKSEISEMAHRMNLQNISFVGLVSPFDLPKLMSEADLCLGQFGGTEQGNMVIPTKIFDSIAMRLPVVSGENPVIKETFSNGEIYVVPMKNSKALADAIIFLYQNSDIRGAIATKGYEFFVSHANSEVLGKKIKTIISEIVRTHKKV